MKRFKQVLAEATPKVTGFPAIIFPVVQEGSELKLKSVPVLQWSEIEAIEREPKFVVWAADPRTGKVNFKIDQAVLSAAAKAWVDAMKPTSPH